MVVNIPDTNAHRFQKAFDCDTRIIIQVRGAQTITLSREQGSAQSGIDGLQFTQTSTNPPYDMVWQGELWYKTDTPGSTFNIEIIGTVGGSSTQP